MKTSGLIAVVLAIHCLVVGLVFFISGCGATPKVEAPTALPAMPAPQAPLPQPAALPLQPKPMLPESKLAGGGEYTVQPGDTLSAIAKRCGVTMAEITAANNLADPNKLKVGQKLVLPAHGLVPPVLAPSKPVAKAKPAAPKPAAPAVALGANEYLVQPGDNLSKIAARHGIKVSALREANKLQSDKLMIGQKLVLPTAPTQAAAAQEALKEAPQNPEIAPAASASEPPVASGIIHIVQPDEDIDSIAKLYAVTVNELVELNKLAPDQAVQAGQRLNIP